jgi:hypothetical protein
MSRRIVIEAVERAQMRPPYRDDPEAAGDWFFDANGDLVVQVAAGDVLNHDHAFLAALHELVEAKLCAKHGIRQEQVDQFDLFYRGDREPGDDWASPYRREHRQACLIEFLVADMLGHAGYGTME